MHLVVQTLCSPCTTVHLLHTTEKPQLHSMPADLTPGNLTAQTTGLPGRLLMPGSKFVLYFALLASEFQKPKGLAG